MTEKTDDRLSSFGASSERIRKLIDNSYELIHLIDAEGRIVYMGPSVKTLLGYEPEEMIGKISHEFLHPEDRMRVLTGFKEILKMPGIVSPPTKMRLRRKDGTYVPIEAVAQNLLHIPDIASIVVHSHDVSEEVRVAEELKKRNEELERAVKLMSGREKKMVELKQEVESLKEELRKKRAG